jgi:hypothetical protein
MEVQQEMVEQKTMVQPLQTFPLEVSLQEARLAQQVHLVALEPALTHDPVQIYLELDQLWLEFQ